MRTRCTCAATTATRVGGCAGVGCAGRQSARPGRGEMRSIRLPAAGRAPRERRLGAACKPTPCPPLHITADAASEKVARGALLSAIDRCLTRRRTVILDTHNNIKGYRYQLWCIARQVGVRVGCGTALLGRARLGAAARVCSTATLPGLMHTAPCSPLLPAPPGRHALLHGPRGHARRHVPPVERGAPCGRRLQRSHFRGPGGQVGGQAGVCACAHGEGWRVHAGH